MSFSDLCLRLVGWIDKTISPPNLQEGGSTQPEESKPKPALQQYAPIRRAVEGKLEHLVRHEIPEHRELAENDSLELYYVEIEAATEEGQALLDAFCQEFNPAARQQWVRKFIGANATVRLDCLAGVFRSVELPSTSGLDPHLQLLNQGNPAVYSVRLWCKWVQVDGPTPPQYPVNGNPVVLRIHDRQGQREGIRRDAFPIKLGLQSEISVEGTYVSGRHCTLHWRGGQVELEDHSKNGTWVDGAKLHQQTKPLAAGTHQLKLGKGQGDVQEYPEIDVTILVGTVTPTVDPTPLSAYTPIAEPGQTLLAVLSVQDATGSPLIDVLGLPFNIGRSGGNNYVTPPAHAGVSGLHLVIEALVEQGAEVSNPAYEKNGTRLGDALQGEHFLWPYGEEITLAPKWKNDPPVRILLQRPR